MADDKKSGGFDELKARLGLDSVLSKARRVEDKPEAPAPPPPEVAATAPPTPMPPPKPVPDYSQAVSMFEEPAAGEGEPEPVYSGLHDGIDPNIAAPVSRGTKMALLGAGIAAVLLALAAGYGFGRVMRDREVTNQVIETAGDMLRQIEPVAEQLTAFQQQLAQHGDDFSEELHRLFVGTFESSPPVVSSRTLSDGRIIMTTGEDLARDLINYALSTQILQAMIQEHLRKTVHDRNLISRLLESVQQVENYAVIFDSDELIRNFRAFYEDPEANPYVPTRGYVVTYDNLDVETEGEGEAQTFKYQVLAGGQRTRIEIYNLLTLDAEQLVGSPHEETALSRYRNRVRGIRDQLDTIIRMQEGLILELRERSEGSRAFTI